MSVKLADLTQVKSFSPVHALGRFGRKTVLDEFIATQEGAEIIESVIESITGERLPETAKRRQSALSFPQIRRSHLVRANFGTGKTITLLALSEMLAATGDPERFAEWRAQFHRFPTVQLQYDKLRERTGGLPFVCLMIDMKEKGSVPFRDVVVRALHEWLQTHRPGLTLNSEFTSAADHLDSAAARLPQQLQDALDHHAPGLTVAELRQDLLSWDRSKLDLAYRVMQEAAGFSPTRQQVEMRSYYDDARQMLNGEFGGVAVVLDELHHFFTTSANFNTLAISLADFDAFAVYMNETKSDTGMPCVLAGAIHENLGSYLKGNGYPEDAFQQAVGRFDEHPLTSSVSQAELIAGAFMPHPDDLRTLLRQNPALRVHTELISQRSGAGDTWLQCFPLHPSVITYLPLLSRRLAQNDRTTFHFIANHVRYWVDQKDAVVNGWLNLILLPDVWNYFAKAIEERDAGIIRAVNNAVSYCGGGVLHRQIMETLACLHVASSVTTADANYRVRSGATIEMLLSYLNFPQEKELRAALQDLSASGYIQLSDWNEYFLVASGGLSHVELNRRIDQMAVTIDPDQYLVQRLKTDWNVRGRTVFPASHTHKECISRSFAVQLVTVAELRAFNDALGQGYSGRILFVVPPLDWDAERLRKETESEFARLQAQGAMVALPQRWDEIKAEAIRRQEALKALKNAAGTEEQKRTIDEQLVREEEQLTERLVAFGQPGNWLFYSAYGVLQSKRKTLADVLELIGGKLYPKFPEFTAGNLQQPTLIHGLLDRFLPNPINQRCDTTTKSRVDSILAAVGLAGSPAEDPACYSLKAPSDPVAHPKSLAVWQELESLNLAGDKPLERLYQRLMTPPYGLLAHMVELYLAVFIRVRGIAVFNRKTGQHVLDLQSRVLKDISQHKDQLFRLDMPTHTSGETLAQLAAIWAPLAKLTGSHAYLGATDASIPDGAKRGQLVQDVIGWCDLITTRVLTPLRTLGAADEAGEGVVQALGRAVSATDVPAGETFQLVLAACTEADLERLCTEAAAAGLKLSTLAASWRAFQAVPAPEAERYPDLGAAHTDVAGQIAGFELSRAESVSRLEAALAAFQTLYLAYYATEHDELQEGRAAFGKALLASPLFALLRSLGKVHLPESAPKITRASAMEAAMLAEQKLACRQRGSGAMLSAGACTCGDCPDGGYELGTSADLTRELHSRAERLQEDLVQAVRDWLELLNQLESAARAAELGLPGTLTKYLYEHDKAAVGALSLLKVSLQMALDAPESSTADAQDQLQHLAGPLGSYLAGAAGRGGAKRTRMTLLDVVTKAEAMLVEEGLHVIALEPENADERRRAILSAIERALSSDENGILEIVLRRKSVG